MKCEKCKSEWSSSRSLQVCPFCGESLVQPESKKPEGILCYIVDEYGVEVLQKKKLLLSYFSDFAPHLNKEYKLLKNCCSTDFISILLSSGSSKDSREIAIKKAIRLLMDECFMLGQAVELIHPARLLFNAGSTPKAWNVEIVRFCSFFWVKSLIRSAISFAALFVKVKI